MKQFLLTIAGVFVGLMLFLVGLPILLLSLVAGHIEDAPAQPKNMVLVLDLRGKTPDQAPKDLVLQLGHPAQSVVGIVTTLAAAESDPHVKGLFIRAPEGGLAPASAEELHMALSAFRKSGKFVVAHSQGIYSPLDYLTVSSANQVWMQASSDFVAPGLSMETPFLRDLLDRVGAQPEMMHFYEYKNAADPLLEKTYTAPYREAETALLSSIFSTAISLTATGRGMSPEVLRATLTKGPLSAADAMASGLIDKIGYDDEAAENARKQAGNNAELVDIGDYDKAHAMFEGKGPKIALIEGEGVINTGASNGPDFRNSPDMLGDDISTAIRDAADNKNIRAIVFRVNSPGGSPVASDQIWAAVNYAKDKGKPVVISMGPYAASGGYYVSASASAIVANASTITGSIGVVGGKVAFHNALRKVGVNLEGITVGGDFASAESSRPYTDTQREQMRGILTRIYNDFTAKVATGRDLPLEAVQAVAKGRVWSGADAKDRKLVDEIGGLRTAIDVAKRLAKIPADKPIHLVRLPEAKNPFDEIRNLLQSNLSMSRKLSVLAQILSNPHVAAVLAETTTVLDDQSIEMRQPALAIE